MDAAGGGGFEIVAADRAVHQGADVPRVEAAGGERAAAAFGADAADRDAGGKESPLADAGHQLQPARRQPQPLVGGRQPALQLVARDDFVRQDVAEALRGRRCGRCIGERRGGGERVRGGEAIDSSYRTCGRGRKAARRSAVLRDALCA